MAAPDPLAGYLEQEWVITLETTVVIDLTQSPAGAVCPTATFPLIRSPRYDPATIMPQARSLGPWDGAEGRDGLTSLIHTSKQSWGETDYAQSLSGEVQYDEGVDQPGPLTLAAAGDNAATSGRVVVFGNSLFATDQAFDAYGNGDIFMNSVDWSAQQDNLIQITPRAHPAQL